MTISSHPIHRLSGVMPSDPELAERLSTACALQATGVLQSTTIEILQTLAPLFPDANATALAAAGILLQSPSDGHTCLTSEAIAQRWQDSPQASSDVPETPPIDATAIAEALEQSGDFCQPWNATSDTHPQDAAMVEAFGHYYLHRSAVTEHEISRALRARLQLSRTDIPDLNARIAPLKEPMHAAQFQAVSTALQERFMLLTGGPGTGKTWTVRAILAVEMAVALQQGQRLPRIALAAPTGKAAARMLESLHADLDAFIEKTARSIVADPAHLRQLHSAFERLDAQTLHRLLQVYQHTDTPTFVHADLVIVDEVSMVDAPMMARLLHAISPHTRLILIGDPHQLASVEAGSVLSDFVALSERIPAMAKHVVKLTKSHRFGEDSTIGQLARAALENRPDDPVWDRAVQPTSSRGELDAQTIDALAEGYLPLLKAVQAHTSHDASEDATHDARSHAALAALSQYQILCAHHRGPRSVRALNESITRALIQRGAMRPQGPGGLSVGMPIMILRNDYALQRYNGDVGVITAPGIATFVAPDGDGLQHIAVSRLPEHRIAFAMTVHKSQGSEWQDVRIVLPPRPSRILTRELLYTAISRARDAVHILAPLAVLQHGIAHQADRATGLISIVSSQWEASHAK